MALYKRRQDHLKGPEDSMDGQWAIIGATGRLGRAIGRALGPTAFTGMARNPPQSGQIPRLIRADCGDVAALSGLLADADRVLHLCLHAEAHAEALLAAAGRTGRWPRLVVASSIAERPFAAWQLPDDAATAPPDDPFGAGLRAVSERILAQWPGAAIALLPQLVTPDDPQDHLALWARQSQRGALAVPGSGRQRPALLHVDDAAELLLDLARRADVHGRVTLAHPEPATALELAHAVASGAGHPTAALVAGSDNRIVSAGDERLNLQRMTALWPARPWVSLPQQVNAAAAKWLS